MGRGRNGEGREWSGVIVERGVREGDETCWLTMLVTASFSFMSSRFHTWMIVIVCGCLVSFVGSCPCPGTVVFVHGPLSSYVCSQFHTCAVVFKQMQVSGVVGVDVVVVVVASMVGVIVVVATMVVVVVMGRVLIFVHCCGWWAMGGHCQSCDGRMGTVLTYDGDDTCCCHQLDNVAMPHHLPTHSAVGAGDVVLLCCCYPMVCAVLVVGG